MARPKLTSSLRAQEFDSYYWYKNELLDFAARLGVSTVGSKFALHDRISDFLATGKVQKFSRKTPVSNFDWQRALLAPDTIITDNYKNTRNVRRFFQTQVGPKFAFSLDLMNFMRRNEGETLAEAVEFYRQLQLRKKQGYRQVIPEGNQYNRYLRDFLRANPDLSKETAVSCWLAKIQRPRPGSKGRGFYYEVSDLDFLKSG